MPNWKKLIVSGSDATLNSLNVSQSVAAASYTIGTGVYNPEKTWKLSVGDNNSDFHFYDNNYSTVVDANNPRRNFIFGVTPSGTKQYNTYFGFGTDLPGERFHLTDGNFLMEGNGETAMMFKRGTTFTSTTHPSAPFASPIFKIGRIIQGGDGAPQFRWMYQDDNRSEHVVMELDSEGIMSSVRQSGNGQDRGSHFEAHTEGHEQPYFRLNSYPYMQLQMGHGNNDPTDVSIGRSAANTLNVTLGSSPTTVTEFKLGQVEFKQSVDVTQGISAGWNVTAGDSLKSSGIKIGWDTIEQVGSDVDGASIAINYNGYDGGTTRYRNLGVFDGKNGIIWDVVGSTRKTQFYGDVGMEEDLIVEGTITGSALMLSNIANAGTDTDKFLVLDSLNNVDFRTGAQVLSDIGGQTLLTNPVTGTGTTNYLPKFTGTSALGNSLVYDDGTKVGIGTTSPVLKLHLIGTNSLPATSGTTQNGGIRIENGVNNGVLDIGASNATGAPGWIQSTDKADLSQTYNLLLNPNGGNVGIGTTSPSRKLQVEGGDFYTSDKSDTIGASVGYGGNSFQIRNGSTSEDLNFDIFNRTTSAWGTPFVIKNSGNVGIGTNNPATVLDVAGEGTAIGSTGYSYNARFLEGSENVGVLIGHNNTSNGNGMIAGVNKLAFLTYGTAWGERMIIDGDGSIQLPAYGEGFLITDASGNVSVSAGSGTSSDTLDDVTGRGNTTTNSIEVGGLQVEDTIGIKRSGVNAITTLQQTGEGLILNSPSGYHPFVIQYDGSELFRFSNSGNLGIGTISPSAVLDLRKDDDTVYDPTADDGQRGVGATIQLNNNSTTTNTFGQIMYDTDSSGQAVARIVFLDAGTASSAIAFVTENSETKAERMRIASNGNVGIGTDSPQYKIHSSNSGTRNDFQFTLDSFGTGATNGAQLGIQAGGAYIWNFENNDLYFATNNSRALTIKPTGNVGIGTTSPTDYGATANTLEVRGASGTGTGLIRVSNADNAVGTSLYSSASSGTLNVQTNHPLTFATNNNEKMRITPGGTLLFGDTNVPAESVWKGTAVFGQTGTDKVILGHLESSTDGAIIGGHNASLAAWAPLNIAGTELRFNVEQSRKMTMNSDGNLGIGTTGPTAKLHVLGTSTGDATTKAEMLSNSVFSVRPHATNSGTLAIAQVDSGNSVGMQFTNGAGTSNWDISLQPFGGNVGIGTTTPDDKLDIESNHSQLRLTDSDDSTFTQFSSSGGKLAIRQDSTTASHFWLTSNGNVGIGTDNPGAKLEVNGDINVSGGDIVLGGTGRIQGIDTVSAGTDAANKTYVDNHVAATSTASSLYDLIPNGAFTTTYAFTSTAGTWAEVMEGNDVITSTGTYSIQVFVDDHGVGGTQYDEFYSGTMSWFAAGTNDAGGGAISEIVLHRAGHAANTGVIYLRTRETTNAETNKLKLEVMSNKTYTGASNLIFKFVRLI